LGLKKLIARRVLLTIPTVLGVITLLFVAISPLPPLTRVAFYLNRREMYDVFAMQKKIEAYGLNRPIIVQWAEWIVKVAHFDFGLSMAAPGVPAMELIFNNLPTTLELILYSAPWIILSALWLGTKAAVNHDKPMDHAARIVATLGTTLPVFLLAALLVATTLLFYNQLHFIPLEGLSRDVRIYLVRRIENGTFTSYTGMNTIDSLLNGDMQLFLDALAHLILPVLLLVFTQGVGLMRVTRSGLIEELGKQYMTSARAKGLSNKDTVYRHARKNALVAVLTLSGLLLGNMVTGLVIVERVFMIPGLGNLLVYSSQRLDVPVVIAGSTFVAVVFVLMNLIIDILYGVVDPRIRVQ
jgi:peptide/nickel transport system permease protein